MPANRNEEQVSMLVTLARNKLVWLYAALIVIYVVLTFAIPPDPEVLTKYKLSSLTAKFLSLTVVVPLILIWITALVGYLRLESYVDTIKKSKDGAAFRTLAQGVLWLGLWLPLSSLSGIITKYYYDLYPAATANLVRLDNYFNLLLLIPGFLFVYQGSKQLMPLVKRPAFSPPQWIVLGFIAFAVLYTVVTLKDPVRLMPGQVGDVATYYLSDWLIALTLIIPRLFLWFIGGMAVYNIYVYSKLVKGTLYRSALTSLAAGLAGVVLLIISLRFLQSMTSTLNELSLAPLLGVIYLLLLLMGVGYIFIAIGAKNLKRLEDI